MLRIHNSKKTEASQLEVSRNKKKKTWKTRIGKTILNVVVMHPIYVLGSTLAYGLAFLLHPDPVYGILFSSHAIYIPAVVWELF